MLLSPYFVLPNVSCNKLIIPFLVNSLLLVPLVKLTEQKLKGSNQQTRNNCCIYNDTELNLNSVGLLLLDRRGQCFFLVLQFLFFSSVQFLCHVVVSYIIFPIVPLLVV
jgi:hypothetical protein